MTNVELIRQADFSPNYFYTRLRGDALFDTNDIDKIASVFGVSPAEIIVLAGSLSGEDDTDTVMVIDSAELGRRLRFLAAPLPEGTAAELLRAGGAEVTAEEWSSLLDGSGPRRMSHSLLTALAGHFNVSEKYLTELGSTDVAQRVEAEVEFQRALHESGASAVAARALGEVSPGALQAITESIRSIDRGR